MIGRPGRRCAGSMRPAVTDRVGWPRRNDPELPAVRYRASALRTRPASNRSSRHPLCAALTPLSRDPDFGLFTETGRQLLENATFEGFPSRIKCQRVATPLRRTPALPEIDHAIYWRHHRATLRAFPHRMLEYALVFDARRRRSDLPVPQSADGGTGVRRSMDGGLADLRGDQTGADRHPACPDDHPPARRCPARAFCEDAFAYQIYGAFGRAIGEDAARPPPFCAHDTGRSSRGHSCAGAGSTSRTNPRSMKRSSGEAWRSFIRRR